MPEIDVNASYVVNDGRMTHLLLPLLGALLQKCQQPGAADQRVRDDDRDEDRRGLIHSVVEDENRQRCG